MAPLAVSVRKQALGIAGEARGHHEPRLPQALRQGARGLIALSLILVDEVDNAYGDVYSGAVSAHSLRPRWSVRRWGLGLALLCTGLALVLVMAFFEGIGGAVLLVAAWAFSRSSPRLEAWLLNHPHFGHHIVAWREKGAISRKGKIAATAAFALSIVLADVVRWVNSGR